MQTCSDEKTREELSAVKGQDQDVIWSQQAEEDSLVNGSETTGGEKRVQTTHSTDK